MIQNCHHSIDSRKVFVDRFFIEYFGSDNTSMGWFSACRKTIEVGDEAETRHYCAEYGCNWKSNLHDDFVDVLERKKVVVRARKYACIASHISFTSLTPMKGFSNQSEARPFIRYRGNYLLDTKGIRCVTCLVSR